mmetsp:Transcript_88270/g.273510  ORF Transcript_88270/g.273510 Transcript_88270/m.273510 type:complete len:126 (+) Transcript_88270:648-1025(+)
MAKTYSQDVVKNLNFRISFMAHFVFPSYVLGSFKYPIKACLLRFVGPCLVFIGRVGHAKAMPTWAPLATASGTPARGTAPLLPATSRSPAPASQAAAAPTRAANLRLVGGQLIRSIRADGRTRKG